MEANSFSSFPLLSLFQNEDIKWVVCIPRVTWRDNFMYDACVCFLTSLDHPGRKNAIFFFFRLKVTLMFCFKLAFPVLIGKRLCILQCKPIHFHKWKQDVPLLAF